MNWKKWISIAAAVCLAVTAVPMRAVAQEELVQEKMLEELKEEQQEELNRTIRLSKWDGDRKDGWEIRVDTNPNLNSLRNLHEFDLLLFKLQRADVRIIADELSDEDYVYSDTKPEPTYE